MSFINITTTRQVDGEGAPEPSRKRRLETEGDSPEGEESSPLQRETRAQSSGAQGGPRSRTEVAKKRIAVSSASASVKARAMMVEKRRAIVLSSSDSDTEFPSPGDSGTSGSEKEEKPGKQRGRGRPETTGAYRIKKAEQEAKQIRERLAREVEEHEKLFDETYSPALTTKLLLKKEEVVEEAKAAAIYEMATVIEAQMAAIHRVAVTASNLKGTQVKALREAAVRAGVFATALAVRAQKSQEQEADEVVNDLRRQLEVINLENERLRGEVEYHRAAKKEGRRASRPGVAVEAGTQCSLEQGPLPMEVESSMRDMAQGERKSSHIEGPSLRGKPRIIEATVIQRAPLEVIKEEGRRIQAEMTSHLEQLFRGWSKDLNVASEPGLSSSPP